MKQGWELKKLGEIVDFKRGLTYSKKDEVDYSSNIVLRANNVDLITNKLDFEDLKYINENVVVPEEKKVKKGSLLICTASGSKSHLGKVALIDDEYDFSFGGFMGQITPRPSIASKFLFYALTSDFYKEFIGNLSDGVNINNLKYDDLKQFSFRVPSLPEQQRVVAIIDEVFASIARVKTNAEQNLKNAKELFESYLQEVFANKGDGWINKTLADVCLIVNGGTPDTTIPEYWDGDNLWITPKDMGKLENIYVDDTSRKITDAGLKNSSAKVLPISSIILSSRAPIGHLAVNKKPISTNQGCKGLIPSKNISTVFIYYFLKKSVELLNNLGTGATFRELSSSKLAEVIIPIPKTLNEQLTIVQKLDTLSAETKKLEAIYQQKINDLEELKRSILQKAFNGELKKT